MESFTSSSPDPDPAARLSIVGGTGLSSRPMLIRGTTGLNCIFPFTVFLSPFKKVLAGRRSRKQRD